MEISVRREVPADWPGIEKVVRDAFGRPDEARLVAGLRTLPNVLSLVALVDGAVVGHAMFSPVTARGRTVHPPAYGLAPVSVAPSAQRRRVGFSLIEFGLHELTRSGAGLVVVLGHASYYPRFGFLAAAPLAIHCKWGGDDGTFQVLELVAGAAAAYRGIVDYLPAFDETAW